MRRLLALSLCLLVGCGDADDEDPLRVYVAEGDGGGSGKTGGAGMGEGEGGTDGEGGSDGEGGTDGLGGKGGVAGSDGGDDGGSSGSGAVGGTGGSPSGGSGGGAGAVAQGGGAGQAGKSGTGGKGGTAGKGGAAGAGGKGGAAGKSGASGAGGASGKGGAAGTSGAGGGVTGDCPAGMAFVADGAFCIDRWEAQVEVQAADGTWSLHSPYDTLDAVDAPIRALTSEGVPPQGYISGVQSKEACEGAGKRLCTYDEHLTACSGPEDFTWPYGDTRVIGKCNEGREKHPVIEMFGPGATFNNTELNDPGLNQLPDSLADTGARTECVSAYGAYDLSGNLHEWVDDPAGTFVGGFYVDAVKNFPGCLYKTTAHAFGYHDYSTGFRCCASPL